MYDGLCFKNMNREDLDSKDLDYIDKHLFILSALYGAVRPFDLISPYRLDFLMKTEMGNLYKFWQDEIAKKVLEDEDLIVNLASDEFSKTIKKSKIAISICTLFVLPAKISELDLKYMSRLGLAYSF